MNNEVYMKVVINEGIGGFDLSSEAILKLVERGIISENDFVVDDYDGSYHIDPIMFERHDPDLVEIVEELGENASGKCAELTILEIPDGMDYYVMNEDMGNEYIAEAHRVWIP